MADPYKRLRRQVERQKRKAHYRQLHEDQLLDVAYRGYTQEQKQLNNLDYKPSGSIDHKDSYKLPKQETIR